MVTDIEKANERLTYWKQVQKQKEEQINKGQWSAAVEKEYSYATYKVGYWQEGIGYIQQGASFSSVQGWTTTASRQRLNQTPILSYQQRQTPEGKQILAQETAGVQLKQVVVVEDSTHQKQQVPTPTQSSLKPTGSVGYYYNLEDYEKQGGLYSDNVYSRSETRGGSYSHLPPETQYKEGHPGYAFNPYPTPSEAFKMKQDYTKDISENTLSFGESIITPLYYSQKGSGKLVSALPFGLTPFGTSSVNWYKKTETGYQQVYPKTIVSEINRGLLWLGGGVTYLNEELRNPIARTKLYKDISSIKISSDSPLYYTPGTIAYLGAISNPNIFASSSEAMNMMIERGTITPTQEVYAKALVKLKGDVSLAQVTSRTETGGTKIDYGLSSEIIKQKEPFSVSMGRGVQFTKTPKGYTGTYYNLAGVSQQKPLYLTATKDYGTYSMNISNAKLNVQGVMSRGISETIGTFKVNPRSSNFLPGQYEKNIVDTAGFIFRTNKPNVVLYKGQSTTGANIEMVIKTTRTFKPTTRTGGLSGTRFYKQEVASTINQVGTSIPKLPIIKSGGTSSPLIPASSVNLKTTTYKPTTRTEATTSRVILPQIAPVVQTPKTTETTIPKVLGASALIGLTLPTNKVNQTPIVTPIPKETSIPKETQKVYYKLNPIQKGGLIFPGTSTPIISMFPTIPTTPGFAIPPLWLNFQFGKSELGTQIWKGGKKVTGYTPSFTALFKRQYGSKPKSKVGSGIDYRPITQGFKFKSGLFNFKKLFLRFIN